MWRPQQDPNSSGGTPGPKSLAAHGKANPEMLFRPGGLDISQHPSVNPTPFVTYATAWTVGTTPAGDYSHLHAHPPGNLIHAPSELLPQGLLKTPPPSTSFLKALASRGLTIYGPEASYGNNPTGNGATGESPATVSGALQPVDSLVLPSPSLLPGGVHSLPTPTSTSSQQHRPNESYGSRNSPADTTSGKESTPSPPAESDAAAAPQGTAVSRRPDAAPQQPSSASSSGANGSNGAGQPSNSRGPDGPTTSASTSTNNAESEGTQTQEPPHPQPTMSSSTQGGSYSMSHSRSMAHVDGYSVHHHLAHQQISLASGVGAAQGSGPAVGYSTTPYYMAPLPPGAMMVSMHPQVGGATAGHNSSSVGGGGVPGPARDNMTGGTWRGSWSSGGAGGSAAGGGAGSGPGVKHHAHYGQQQQMQGHMMHDGSGAGMYGMPRMHAAPYAMYSMMAPGIVVPQVLSPVVGSPRGIEPHGALPHHHHAHLGPMMVPHGPSLPVGMGIGMGMTPVHPFPHGPMIGPHMHMHMQPHHHHHGGPHGMGTYPHHGHSMPGGFQGHHSRNHSYSPQPFSHAQIAPVSSLGSHAGPFMRNGGRVAGSTPTVGSAPLGGYSIGQKGQVPARVSIGNGELLMAGPGSGRNSPLAPRGRRDKTEKSRSSEQRERKPGNSRAPALIAHCAADISSLDEQMRDLVRQLTPGSDELDAHQAALGAVAELVEKRWPDVQVQLFGSAANGLCLAGANEIDVTLVAPTVAWDDHPAKAAMVSELGELASGGATAAAEAKTSATPTPDAAGTSDTPNLENTDPESAATCNVNAEAVISEPGAAPQDQETASSEAEADSCASPHVSTMKAVSALPKARTPVVKLTVSATQTRVDITINNLLAVSNTRLLGHYCELDPRLRQMVLLVKHWAKIRGVNDAYRGSLSSYAYALLCIWLLQQRQPPILPVLQQRQPHTYDVTVGPWRCSYNDQIQDMKDFGVGNRESLAQLLVAFFDHWAWRHDYNGSVVCVRTGGTVSKSAKEWTKRQGNERHLMCIEDPFELSHDLGRTIDKAAVQVLRREFERAARIFSSSSDPMSELLAPLTPEEEAAVAAALQSRRKASKDKDKSRAAAAAAAAATANVPVGASEAAVLPGGAAAAEAAAATAKDPPGAMPEVLLVLAASEEEDMDVLQSHDMAAVLGMARSEDTSLLLCGLSTAGAGLRSDVKGYAAARPLGEQPNAAAGGASSRGGAAASGEMACDGGDDGAAGALDGPMLTRQGAAAEGQLASEPAGPPGA